MSRRASPYLEFSRHTWSQFRKDTPLLLKSGEIKKLQGQIEKVSLKEVEEVYLPLSRLLNMYVAANINLYDITEQFLGHLKPKVPYIIGVAGSVAVGKSTASRILKALLSRWPEHRGVDIITTDGFLFPNAILQERNLMERKGFPESYDVRCLINILSDLKAGKAQLRIPVYSHHSYDIVPDKFQIIDQPDIVIVEGLNVLQTPSSNHTGKQVFVSDFFDFSIYVDAETAMIKQWFLDRFMLFRKRAKEDTSAFFHQFAKMRPAQALSFAEDVWTNINERNLNENILPYKHRARLILAKSQDHAVEKVFLRKL